jgi:hypothetical protein
VAALISQLKTRKIIKFRQVMEWQKLLSVYGQKFHVQLTFFSMETSRVESLIKPQRAANEMATLTVLELIARTCRALAVGWTSVGMACGFVRLVDALHARRTAFQQQQQRDDRPPPELCRP